MKITPVKLPLLQPPQDDLFAHLDSVDFSLGEDSIVVLSSKVVAIHQGRCIKIEKHPDKDSLIKQEAEEYMERDVVPQGFLIHTIKYHMLVGSAGIDESNANDHYILLPDNPDVFAEEFRHYLQKRFDVNNLGVIITDSHSVPMRRGTVGISIANFGFRPLHDYRHQDDLFGRELKISISNLADGLAAAATVVMGEGSEQTPLTIIEDLQNIEFSDKPFRPVSKYESYYVEPDQDLYKPFFEYPPWQKGEGGKGSKKT